MVIDGYKTFVIENCTFIQTGNIYVRDWGKLVVRNAELIMNESYLRQYNFVVKNQGTWEMEEGAIVSFDVWLFEEARVTLNHSKANTCIWASDSSDLTVVNNSKTGLFRISGHSKFTVANSAIECISLSIDDYAIGEIDSLIPGYCKYWNSRQNETSDFLFNLTLVNTSVAQWGLRLNYGSRITVSNSENLWIEVVCRKLTAQIERFVPAFYSNLSLGLNMFKNTSVKSFLIDIFTGAIVFINNSTLLHLTLHEDGVCSILNSEVSELIPIYYFGRIEVDNQTELHCINVRFSIFEMRGNAKLEKANIQAWLSSNVTRNCNVIVRDAYGQFVSNANLTLKSRDGISVWNGSTDRQGKANFNITFNDNNYRDFWTLTAAMDGLKLCWITCLQPLK